MQKVKVTKHSSVQDNGMGEIYQSMGVRQALLRRIGDNSYERVSNYVKCRDFLVDSYTYAQVGKKFTIYGYTFDGAAIQPDWEGARLLLQFPDKISREDFLRNIGYLHSIEHANGWPQTVILSVEGSTDLVADGSKLWLNNCLTFSLFSYLLRVCCYKDQSKSNEPTVGEWLIQFSKKTEWSDAKYAASISKDTWDKVLGNLNVLSTKTWCGFDPRNTATHAIHHNSGFISVFGSHSEISYTMVRRNAHWQEMYERGLEMHPEALKVAA